MTLPPPEQNLAPAAPQNFQIGNTVHRWTLLSFWRGPEYPKIMVLAQCACGSPRRLVQLQNIANGNSTNCGCVRKQKLTKHGLSGHPLYRVWHNMLQRCTNPGDPAYRNYGARSISVCQRWLSVKNFISDMEPSYRPGLEIDREDNNGNYEPGNCRWVTIGTQNRNRRTTIHVEHEGERLPLHVWAERLGVPYSRLHKRYEAGMRGTRLLDATDKRTRTRRRK